MNNKELLKEILLSKEQGELTDKAIDFIVQIVKDVSDKDLPRWNLNEEEKIEVGYKALEKCMNHSLDFDIERMKEIKEPRGYITNICRCSILNTTLDIKREKGEIPKRPPGTVVVGCGEWAEVSSEGVKIHKNKDLKNVNK